MVRDGWVMVIPLAALAAVSVVIGYLASGAIWIVLASLFGGLALFVAFFFRDPTRQVPPGDGLVISGGDGKVMSVEEIELDPFIGGPASEISVF
ncbi:MAG: phosphatidylserine decarboxylase family protein, partial [Gemmatimonadetes bacterium]|nr:phosphatidylserine decarboxylase family protein [Gemmatimonadota bacterium]